MREFDLRALQLSELDILKEVDRICKENDITYFLTWGTAIGAVRHSGFIPWDDDIDISMLPRDYIKFKEVAKTQMKEPYFYQDWSTDPYSYLSWAKIRNSDTTSMEKRMSNYPINWGVCIDIFPLIPTPEAQIDKKTEWYLKCMNVAIAKPLDQYGYCDARYGKYLPYLPSGLCRYIKNYCFDKLMNRNSDMPYVITEIDNRRVEPRAYYNKTIQIQFEDMEFPISADYHDSLTCCYGDYMKEPEVKDRIDHGDIIVDLEKGYAEYQ